MNEMELNFADPEALSILRAHELPASSGGLVSRTANMNRLHGQRPSPRVRRATGEKGATLVEFAFVVPIFFLLLLGMIDFGFAYGDYIGLRNGVREGARQAVVSPPGSDTCGLPGTPSAATENLVCVTKERTGLADADVKVAVVLLDGDADSTAGEIGEAVLVCVQTPAKSTSGMTAPFLNGRMISAKARMRIEVSPTYSAYNEGGVSCT